jgi:hypothetical protein
VESAVGRIEYRTPDGMKVEKCADLKSALEIGYERAMSLPLDPNHIPEVSVFDDKGFVIRIEKLKIINREMAQAAR